MDYYVIEMDVINMIMKYLETDYFQNMMKKDISKSINMEDIHFDRHEAIGRCLIFFREAYHNEEIPYEEYHLITNSLNMRKDAIRQITFDVCQKHAISAINCGNL